MAKYKGNGCKPVCQYTRQEFAQFGLKKFRIKSKLQLV